MEEIKVGEYVITQNRLVIGKIIDSANDDTILIKTRKAKKYISKCNIKCHSFELIDLIEVGDYVNGEKILSISPKRDYLYAERIGFEEKDILLERNVVHFWKCRQPLKVQQ